MSGKQKRKPVAYGLIMRQLREEQQKTQETVASAVGLDNSTYARIEREEGWVSSWRHLLNIAAALSTSAHALVARAEGVENIALAPDEHELLRAYRMVGAEQRQALRVIATGLAHGTVTLAKSGGDDKAGNTKRGAPPKRPTAPPAIPFVDRRSTDRRGSSDRRKFQLIISPR
jgi:DNA-binding XRE family transcriptional regulator